MNNYSGIYRHYEGTDAECSGVQVERETMWASDIGLDGAYRYTDCSGVSHYIEPSTIWQNYGSDTTISGWANFNNGAGMGFTGHRDVHYKTNGSVVYVNVALAGEGNDQPTTLELPYPAFSDSVIPIALAGANISSTHTPLSEPYILISSGSTVASVYAVSDFSAQIYGSGSYKWLCGQFNYQAEKVI